MTDGLDIIPDERREAAQSALAATFGARPPVALQPIIGGASGALIYRLEVGERPYVLRMEPTQRGGFRDPQRGFACMKAAAEAGVAPALHYSDAATGVAIMDFVASRALTDHPGGAAGLARALGELIGRTHAAPGFPAMADYPFLLERMLGFVRGSGLFAAGLLDPHAELFARIREAYPWNAAALVSSHNDPNPRNILFDGSRLWLVDWETAYRNDPMVDAGIIANDFAPTADLEDMLLQAVLGRAPDRLVRARLTAMRQLTRLYYALLIFSILALAPQKGPELDLTAPSPAEFAAMFADGRVTPGSPAALQMIGRMMLAGFLHGRSEPVFEEALAILRQG